MQIRAIIVDDEQRGRDTLTSLLKTYCEDVELVDVCSNVPDAVLSIRKHKPDLVFLDVEMPVYSGLELLNFFDAFDFEIIFVSAYSEYAIKAFEVSAIDYILKPVEIDQLKRAVEKFVTHRNHSSFQQKLDLVKENLKNGEAKRIALPMNDGLIFTSVDDIVLLQAEGAYTNVFLSNGTRILVSKKLKFFEDLLEGRELYYRTHRSYIIHLNFLNKYLKGEGTIIMEGHHLVSISREKKNEFENKLRDLGIVK